MAGVLYRNYPTKKEMILDLLEVWELKESEKMIDKTWGYVLLEDCKKPAIEELWEKFCGGGGDEKMSDVRKGVGRR